MRSNTPPSPFLLSLTRFRTLADAGPTVRGDKWITRTGCSRLDKGITRPDNGQYSCWVARLPVFVVEWSWLSSGLSISRLFDDCAVPDGQSMAVYLVRHRSADCAKGIRFPFRPLHLTSRSQHGSRFEITRGGTARRFPKPSDTVHRRILI